MVKVVDTWLEVRHPVQLLNQQDDKHEPSRRQHVNSQLAGCYLFKDSVGHECFPLVVRRSNLLTNMAALQGLDVQDLTVGKYVVRWVRSENCDDIEDEDAFCAKTSFEMSTVKVSQSSLYATAELLPSYGVVRTPMLLRYQLVNRTQNVQELAVTMEPSEAFMLSGNKALHIKILPSKSYELNYVLYPLLAGQAVSLPQLKLTSLRLTLTEDLTTTLQRLLPDHITGTNHIRT